MPRELGRILNRQYELNIKLSWVSIRFHVSTWSARGAQTL